jgi:hypothetical protein
MGVDVPADRPDLLGFGYDGWDQLHAGPPSTASCRAIGPVRQRKLGQRLRGVFAQ